MPKYYDLLNHRVIDEDKKPKVFTLSLEDYEAYHEDNMGLCLACGELADGVEPDARNYTCESCDAKKVFGLEECLIMGLVK